MMFGDKIAKCRKENNYTQEQLADLLGVSRQAVSKWESGTAYPETDKLIRMSKLFHCSLDYLLGDGDTDDAGIRTGSSRRLLKIELPLFRERQSTRMIRGLPLWQIGRNAHAIIAIGLNARGILAIGLLSRGVISLGCCSVGLLSFGFLTVGLLSLGLFAAGILAGGCFAAGIIAAGAISLGIISLGAVAIGDFSAGALAIGKYLAIGDHAQGMIALGKTQASGSLYQTLDPLSPENAEVIRALLDEHVPGYLGWAKEIMKLFIH